MYHREQIKELIAIAWRYVRPWYWAIMVYALIAVIYDTYLKPKNEVTYGSHWINYDPTRPASDIKSLDYENRLIIYRPEGRYEELKREPHTTTREDFVDWYDLSDYYDLYEYYHD